MDGKTDDIDSGIGQEIIDGPEILFQNGRGSGWKYKWIEVSLQKCHIKIMETIPEDSGIWRLIAGNEGETEEETLLVQGKRVYNTYDQNFTSN